MKSQYAIQFEQLNLGEHLFEFEVDRDLFNDNEDILDANVSVYLNLYKTGNMMDLKFHYNGDLKIPCDRCNDPLGLKVKENSNLFVKFGQSQHEELDDLLVLEDHEHEIDLKQYFYETICLMIPIRHVHEEKDCNEEILKKLREIESEKIDIDPRWEKLKNL